VLKGGARRDDGIVINLCVGEAKVLSSAGIWSWYRATAWFDRDWSCISMLSNGFRRRAGAKTVVPR
jgi:hypothetical protein